MSGIRICGTGSYLPDNIVANDDYTRIVDTSDEWIKTRTGISTRHIADGETTWRMGARAAARAGISGGEVDLLLVTSVSPDFFTPSMSCVIQQEIGADGCMCIDLNCACAAFAYAVDMARRYLATGDVETALVVSAETLTRITNYEDRGTCVLFGDGAGAVVLRRAETTYGSFIGADGHGYGCIYAKHAPRPSPFTHAPLETDGILDQPGGVGCMVMDGRETYKFSTRMMAVAVEKACEKAGVAPGELKWIVPHQANIRIVQTAMKNLGLPMERAYMTIDHTGNTSSASIPIALDELAASGGLARGDKLAFVGFGAGLTYGAVVTEW